MNYHVNRNGRDLGHFPLQELRRRRATGELNGADAVWCPGMTHWQTLDSLLGIDSSRPPAQKSGATVWIVSIAGVVLMLLLACMAFAFRPLAREAIRALTGKRSASRTVESAIEAATRPIKGGSKNKTQDDLKVHAREFRNRQWLEGYKLRGDRKDSYDNDAVGFLNNWIAYNYGGKIDTNLPSVQKLGDKLAENPDCNDPLLLTVAGIESIELFEANRRLERAVKAFAQSKHKAYPKFYAHVTLADKLMRNNRSRVPALDSTALQLFKECFEDGSFEPSDQFEIAELLLHGGAGSFYKRNRAAVSEIADARGKNFKWLSLVLKGSSGIDAAWAARGSGYSSTVTAKGWAGFETNLREAEESLTEAWKLRPDFPTAPAMMVEVSLGHGGIDEMRQWFDRAIDAQVDYSGAWSSLRWGLRPRWFGNLESMLALGVNAVNTKRFDTDVPRKLFDSIADVESEMTLRNGEHIYGRADVWPHLQDMYEGYIAEPSQAEWRDGWRSTYSVVSYLAGHYDVATKQLEAIHWEPNASNLTGWGIDLSAMALEVAARTGKHGAAVTDAENYRQSRRIEDALRAYTELDGASDLDDRTRAFVKDRLATLTFEKQFQAGDWISLMPANTNLVGWHLSRGTCHSASDNVLEIESGPEGHILYSRARLGEDFEAKGSFEVVKTSSKSFQAGLVMGLPQFEQYGWNAFRIKRNIDEGEISSFSQHWTTKQVSSLVSLSNSNSFSLRCHDGKISASVNDTEIFTNANPPENNRLSTDEFFLGFGAFNDMNTTTIRYRNLQVRKL